MINNNESYWEKITLLIPTNRPWFILRAIEYYNEKFGSTGINVIILDGSSSENFSILSEELNKKKYSLKIRVLHHSESTVFLDRLSEALPLILTPYVLLGADDDFYFFDWLKPAVDLLDRDISYGIVYGHTIIFELGQFKPRGNLVRFFFNQPNPPARWLEGDTPLERLTELGRSNWTNVGWYALQRTEILSIIINNAKDCDLNEYYHFERFFIFCQAALSKTKMLDSIYLARQINSDEKRPPFSFQTERKSLKKLMNMSASILSQYKNIDMESSISIVEQAFNAEISQLKIYDSRRYLIKIANFIPYLRVLKSSFDCLLRGKHFRLDQYSPDSRFPYLPEIKSDHPRIKDIIDAVSCEKKMTMPLVSIGVPVFNGEKGLERSLDSLLEQDYPHLEIIISDNGSTDATPNICRKYSQKDSRVKYYRSEKNLGTTWNFNRVFELSSGKYFVWAAHDDHREQSFVSACVDKMEQFPDAVLCQAYTAVFIEGRREELLFLANLDSFDGVTGLVERYQETLKHFPASAIYGLCRSSALRKTQMFTKSIATEVAFTQELSIYGDFIQVPKVLFNNIKRDKWSTIHEYYRAIYMTGMKPWWYLPFVALFCNHWKRVGRTSIPFSIKLRLWGLLIGYEIRHVFLMVFIKVMGFLCPDMWKEKIGCAIYWRWMHNNPNMIVKSEDLFLERVIKPMLGWWR